MEGTKLLVVGVCVTGKGSGDSVYKSGLVHTYPFSTFLSVFKKIHVHTRTGKRCFHFQKNPDTCGRGLKSNHSWNKVKINNIYILFRNHLPTIILINKEFFTITSTTLLPTV